MDELFKDREHEEKGKRLGRYRIIAKVGEGAVGTVYKALDTSLQRVVALKVLSKRAAADNSIVQRFIREARTTAQLHHPNIVTLYDFEQIGGICCLVMDFIEGASLDRFLQEQKLPLHKSCEIMLGVLDGISYAHQQGIIHRDIKPSNILINAEGKAFVTDFGLAKALANDKDLQISQTGEMLGTLSYMSPEQAHDTKHSVDTRSDIYSLGAMFYRILTGKPPFEVGNPFALMYKLANEKIENPRKIDNQIPVVLDRICMKALAKEKSARYQTAEEMAKEIREYLGKENTTPAPTAPHKWKMKSQQYLDFIKLYPNTVPVVITIAVTLLLGMALGVLWRKVPARQTSPNDQNTNPTVPNTQQAKVPVKINLIYSPPVPPGYPPPYVYLQAEQELQQSKSGQRNPEAALVKLEDNILPGRYKLSVVLQGYKCEDHGKIIEITAGRLVHLTLTMKAESRKVNHKIFNTATNEEVLPLVFHIDDQPIMESRENLFRPGEHNLYAMFARYQEIAKIIRIPPGEGMFRYETTLTLLKDLPVPIQEMLSTVSITQKPDGSSYELEVYADGSKLAPAHLKYEIQGREIQPIIRVAPTAQSILFKFGFYYNNVEIKKIPALHSFEQIDINFLLKHLNLLKEKTALSKELDILEKQDSPKLQHLSAEAQEKLYRFLVAQAYALQIEDSESSLWRLRRLLNAKEDEEYATFKTSLAKAKEFSSFTERVTLWQSFLEKYPKGVYHKRASSVLAYSQDVAHYEQLFREYVRECYLSLSEKRQLQRMENQLEPEDILLVKKNIASYLKELRCKQTLEDMLK